MINFIIFCAIIIIILIIRKYSCKHDWELISLEHTESVMGWKKYKIITQKCKKCGKTEVDKYHMN